MLCGCKTFSTVLRLKADSLAVNIGTLFNEPAGCFNTLPGFVSLLVCWFDRQFRRQEEQEVRFPWLGRHAQEVFHPTEFNLFVVLRY